MSYVDHGWRHGPGGTDPSPIDVTGEGGSYQFKIFRDDVVVVAGDNALVWLIPDELNGLMLVSVMLYVTTVSSSGKPTVQLANLTTGHDMLSTKVSVDVSEYSSYTASVPVVIDGSFDVVTTGDRISFDVDIAGTGAKGMGMKLTFDSDIGGFGAKGEKGDTGATGPPGADGADGAGVPTGGTTGQALVKHSGTNYDTEWADIAGGSGASRAITQTGHGLAVGNLVKYTGSAYAKAQADSAANAEVVGLVSAVAGANDFTLLSVGYVSGLTGLTAGSVYFLSPTTAGALTATEPTTSGQVSKPVLVAVSTTEGFFFNWRGQRLTAASGATPAYAKCSDVKASSTDGGSFTSGAWQTRTLNTEDIDTTGFLVLASNQMTLAAGTYDIRGTAPALNVNRNQVRLYNVTDSVEILLGSAVFCSTFPEGSQAEVVGRFTIAAGKALELQHRCETTSASAIGRGAGITWGANVFAVVQLWKVA